MREQHISCTHRISCTQPLSINVIRSEASVLLNQSDSKTSGCSDNVLKFITSSAYAKLFRWIRRAILLGYLIQRLIPTTIQHATAIMSSHFPWVVFLPQHWVACLARDHEFHAATAVLSNTNRDL
eukprot:35770-Amphidinium_carterae.1